jgi:hypothetical protein
LSALPLARKPAASSHGPPPHPHVARTVAGVHRWQHCTLACNHVQADKAQPPPAPHAADSCAVSRVRGCIASPFAAPHITRNCKRKHTNACNALSMWMLRVTARFKQHGQHTLRKTHPYSCEETTVTNNFPRPPASPSWVQPLHNIRGHATHARRAHRHTGRTCRCSCACSCACVAAVEGGCPSGREPDRQARSPQDNTLKKAPKRDTELTTAQGHA